MANLIPEICKMLGVELGEEFKIKGYGELLCTITDDKGLMAADDSSETGWIPANALFAVLLNGKAEIIKLPWKPKKEETFYTFGIHATEDKWVVVSCKWWDNVKNLALYRLGWIYRSQKEAEAALPTVATEMEVSYEL